MGLGFRVQGSGFRVNLRDSSTSGQEGLQQTPESSIFLEFTVWLPTPHHAETCRRSQSPKGGCGGGGEGGSRLERVQSALNPKP